jgi:F0F1-type ATP synthase assembly protein I
VERKPGLCQIARKVCLLALFGLVAVTLAGPILSLVFVVLTFALIGFLFWLPIHLLIYGKDGAVRDSLEKCQAIARRGLRITAAVCHGSMHVGRELHETIRGTASVIGAVLLETLSGAVVGILLVMTCWPQHAVTPGEVVLAGLLGALAGVLVVVSRARRASEPAVEQSPEGLN